MAALLSTQPKWPCAPPVQAVANMLRVRTLVLQHIAKQDETKTTDFLYAASKVSHTPTGGRLSSSWSGAAAILSPACLVHRVKRCSFCAVQGDNSKVRGVS